jgi:hypothetical protein
MVRAGKELRGSRFLRGSTERGIVREVEGNIKYFFNICGFG